MAYHTRPGKGSGPVFLRSSPTGSSSSNGLPGPVCPVCRNWSIDRWAVPAQAQGQWENPKAPMKVDFFQVAESAFEERCRYCYVIYHALLAMGCDVQIDGFSVLSLHAKPRTPFYVLWDDARVGRSVIEVFRQRDTDCLLNMLGPANRLYQDIRHPAVYDRVRHLLDECEKKHPACLQVGGELPQRLLHIGSSTHFGFRVTAVFPDDVRYIALSHCWGPDTPFTTTWATLTQREEGIEWNDLPLTFQDAITVARHLDVEYIWIDSLCIIQDDKDDWAVESLKMGFIYERAYLTVAAATAAGDREGFLGPSRGREYYTSSTVEMHPFGEDSGVQARRVYDVRSTTVIDPLYTRAWTFQERIMPRRILTFSSAIIFECHTSSDCETGSSIHADPFYRANIGRNADSFFRDKERQFVDLLRRESNPRSLYDLWCVGIVEQVSRRQLTHQRDVLPAISALARRFQAARPDDVYLAGLWRRDLAGSLTWSADSNKRDGFAKGLPEGRVLCRTTREYRAPSWSWASLEGASFYGALGDLTDKSAEHRWRFAVLDAYTDVSSTNPYGEVTGGWLRVRGQLATATLVIVASRVENPDADADADAVALDPEQKPRTALRHAVALTLTNKFGDTVRGRRTPMINLDAPLEQRVVFDGALTTAARVPGGGDWIDEEGRMQFAVRVMLLAGLMKGEGPCCMILGNNGLYGDDATCFERLGIVRMHDDSLADRPDLWREEEFMII